jgi:hypothetical protein
MLQNRRIVMITIQHDDPEVCDGLDNDCNGVWTMGKPTRIMRIRTQYGFGSTNTVAGCTLPTGFVINANDCNDNAVAINPSAQEVCGNGVDEIVPGADAPCGTLV